MGHDVGHDMGQLVGHLFRREAGRLVAALARRLGPAHLDHAEDLVQEALTEALRTWPFRGVPSDPSAWLFRVAYRRALDAARRDAALARHTPALLAWAHDRSDGAASSAPPGSAAATRDDELALLFACCHPALPREAGVTLALTTVGGFSARELARAFLLDEATVAQRVVRAKRRLRAARVPITVPETPAELAARLPAVLHALYLLFNEGYAAGDGDALVRRDLCGEALRLAHLLACDPTTGAPAAHALVALCAFHMARASARLSGATPASGPPGASEPRTGTSGVVLLGDQDRTRWDASLIALGFRHLARSAAGEVVSRYHLEAEIAAHHVAAPTPAATDWAAIRRAYDALLALTRSPVVAVHRAVAIGMCDGAAAALEALDVVASHPALDRYAWFHSTRAHWRAEAGDVHGAANDYRRALALPSAGPVRAFFAARLVSVASAADRGGR